MVLLGDGAANRCSAIHMILIKRYGFKILFLLVLRGFGLASYVAVKLNHLENTITLPSFSYYEGPPALGAYVSVKGSWISDQGVASPLNTTEITCEGQARTCRMVQAEIFDNSLLNLYEQTFDITSWDENFIVFKSNTDITSCVVWTYRIDRFHKQLVGVREKADSYDKERCLGIGLDRFEIKLVDGWDVISKLRGY